MINISHLPQSVEVVMAGCRGTGRDDTADGFGANSSVGANAYTH